MGKAHNLTVVVNKVPPSQADACTLRGLLQLVLIRTYEYRQKCGCGSCSGCKLAGQIENLIVSGGSDVVFGGTGAQGGPSG
jgi:hypothetical protein